jgi:hypothetical protein
MTTISSSTTLGIFLGAYTEIQAGVTITSAQTLRSAVVECLGGERYAHTLINNGVILSSTIDAVQPNSFVYEASVGPGVYFPGTLVNNGTIVGASYLIGGGLVTNHGTMTDGSSTVWITRETGTVLNSGAILGATDGSQSSSTQGIWLAQGGLIVNYQSGTITGYNAVDGTAGTATMLNYGLVSGTAWGIYAPPSADVVNGTDGTITSPNDAIRFRGTGTLLNAGTIAGPIDTDPAISFGGTGGPVSITNLGTILGPVSLPDGGVLLNGPDAKIQGSGLHSGVVWGNELMAGGTTAVTNYGTIGGNGCAYGVDLFAPGTVINAASATIAATYAGFDSIDSLGGDTLLNAGTVIGNPAVRFSKYGTNVLALVPGYAMVGTAVASLKAPENLIELTSAASVGTISGVGTRFIHFQEVGIDPGATWSISVSLTGFQYPADGLLVGGDVTGFAAGDTIELTGVTATETLYSGGVLTVAPGTTLDLSGSFSGGDLRIANTADGADITIACFAEGTLIATARGPVAVERLAAGDRVRSGFGGTVPVVWLGHRRVACGRHGRPREVWPVRIAAGAFGTGRPLRDLWLSPDHAVYVEGGLIPVRYLVNGRTVVQDACDAITYWHVELPAHDVLLAEGLACESYLDTGNRGAFVHGGAVVALQPDFALRVWEAEACAPLVREGAGLVAARRGLLERAAALGHCLTTEPGLEAWVDGREVAAEVRGRRWRVALPDGARTLRLRSRRWVPAETRAAESDTRGLGVAVSGLRLDGVAVGLDDGRLVSGWLAGEGDWRWTDGDATMAVGGASEMDFEVAMTGTYWAEEVRAGARRAG